MKNLALFIIFFSIGGIYAQSSSEIDKRYQRYENGELVEDNHYLERDGRALQGSDFEMPEMESRMNEKQARMEKRMDEHMEEMNKRMEEMKQRSARMREDMHKRMNRGNSRENIEEERPQQARPPQPSIPEESAPKPPAGSMPDLKYT